MFFPYSFCLLLASLNPRRAASSNLPAILDQAVLLAKRIVQGGQCRDDGGLGAENELAKRGFREPDSECVSPLYLCPSAFGTNCKNQASGSRMTLYGGAK